MGIEQFKAFGKKKIVLEISNKNVLGYTRVSSKEQFNNNSLENQKNALNQFALSNNFNLVEIFGGTYESASGDLTRTEFQKLLAKIKGMKTKPYGLLIFKMSRFSRTGANAIGLASKLVEDLGVHLFETSTGRNTTTEQGKHEIYNNLLDARKENITKLSQTVPGMEKHLEKGNWLGKAPRGYDHFGPKVTNFCRIKEKQEIIINKEGRIIQQAWSWKLQGERDCVIIEKLRDLGLVIKKQALSEIWRNPFYCGILASKMLNGKVVQGNWEKIVSEQDFLLVQEILKGNSQGYKHNNSSPVRPLNAFIHCYKCKEKMTGYEVKNKKSHYYKCQKCLGVSINAITTPKAKGIGANDLFMELLNTYQLPKELEKPFQAQLKLTYGALNGDAEQNQTIQQVQLEKLETELKSLNKRYLTNPESDKEAYLEMKADLKTKISEIKCRIEQGSKKISNLDNYISISTDIAQNISKYWGLEGLETKKRIQNLVFPDGLELDTKNRVYLTEKINAIFQQSSELTRLHADENKNDTRINLVSSCNVAGSRLELPTFGL